MAFDFISFPFLAAGIALLAGLIVQQRRPGKLPLPPGPTKLPFIGNLLQASALKVYEWEVYHKWCKQYNSDIIHISIAGLSVIALDTEESIVELLETRSAIYSDRPRMVMVNEIVGWEWAFPFRRADEGWKEQRKVIHKEFHPTEIFKYRPNEMHAAHNMLKRLYTSPGTWYNDFESYLGSIFMSAIYGIETDTENDPYIETNKRANHAVSIMTTPGHFMVEAIPLLKYIPSWFPFADFKRLAIPWRTDTADILSRPFEAVQKDLASGSPHLSCASRALVDLRDTPDELEKTYVVQCALASMAPATDTAISLLRSFVLEMARRPDIQKKVQNELDGVLKRERLPVFSDRDNGTFPYIEALMKELLRHFPVTPIGPPHCSSADDVYNGYFIPAGTVVLPNIWACLHNPDVYADPFVFNPDRFLDTDSHKAERDPDTVVFGFGRRICPGKFIVMDLIFITVTSIMSTFTIEPAVEPSKIPPSGKCQERGVIVHPLTFDITIKPRSKSDLALIQD